MSIGLLTWWQAFSSGVDGFLCRSVNAWEHKDSDKPIPNDAGPRIDWSVTAGGDYNWLNGEGVLLYPGEDGPIGSMRLENIRDGLEDIGLLRQYKARFGTEATARLVGKVTKNRAHYSRDPNVILSARLAVLKALSTEVAPRRRDDRVRAVPYGPNPAGFLCLR